MSSQIFPSDPHLLGFMCPSWVWPGPSHSLLVHRIWQKQWCHFQHSFTKRLWFSSCLSFLAHFDESQLSHCELPYGKPRWQETTHRRSANNRQGTKALGPTWTKSCQQPHKWAWMQTFLLSLKIIGTRYLDFSLWRGTKFAPRFLTHWNCEKANVSCFKLLNLGVFCYAAIDN